MNTGRHILLLGPERGSVGQSLSANGDCVTRTEEDLRKFPELLNGVDWIVSYGYRHIIRPEVIAKFPKRIVNLHISLLPWNRGADPNIWSYLEDTPKGVSIHLIDAGIDTGPLLCQQEVRMSDSDTLKSSYDKLTTAIELLFADRWTSIRDSEISPTAQIGAGSYHKSKDLDPYRHMLVNGWDTPVTGLIRKAQQSAGREIHAL